MSSVFSAFGIAQSDLAAVAEESAAMTLPAEPQALEQSLQRLSERALQELARSGKTGEAVTLQREVLIRYQGQKHEIAVSVPGAIETAADVEALIQRFEERYEDIYGRGTAFRQATVALTGFRIRAIGSLGLPQLRFAQSGRPESATPEYSPVFLRETGGWTDVPFYRFDHLPEKFTAVGPAVIISNHTTIYIAPDFRVRLDEYENLVLSPVS
jgi:N-methylhydantoinase A